MANIERLHCSNRHPSSSTTTILDISSSWLHRRHGFLTASVRLRVGCLEAPGPHRKQCWLIRTWTTNNLYVSNCGIKALIFHDNHARSTMDYNTIPILFIMTPWHGKSSILEGNAELCFFMLTRTHHWTNSLFVGDLSVNFYVMLTIMITQN